MLRSSRLNGAYAALLVIFALGLGLRLYCLDCYSLWFDEIASIEVAQRGLAAFFTDRFGWAVLQTPVHYLIVWLSMQPVDPATTAILVRLPSVLAGALAIPVTYGLGREMFGRREGLLAAVLLAVSPTHISYSQDVRPYAMAVLLTVVSVYCLLVAERTGGWIWWAGFALATAANVANSYHAAVLAMPALGVYMAWALWKLWRGWRSGQGSGRSLVYGLAASSAAGICTLLVLLDLAQVPRVAPNLGLLTVNTVIATVVELLSWLAQLGMSSGIERVTQLILIMLAVVGTWIGVVRGRTPYVVLCCLLTLVPAVLLAVLSTTNVVYQRYALYVLPFFLVLVSNGAMGLASRAWRRQQSVATGRASIAVQYATAALLVIPFLYGRAAQYADREHDTLMYKPDMRGVAAYLQANATAEDSILFAGWDQSVAMFYWKDKPPAPVYNATDPRIFRERVGNRVFWAVSLEFPFPEKMQNDPSWRQVALLDQVRIYEQKPNPDDTLGRRLDWFVRGLNEAPDSDRSMQQARDVFRGSLFQGRGDVSTAARAYTEAGTFFPIGAEYLRSAKGYAARGDFEKAWRDGLISKGLQPQNPEVHDWMAQMLDRQGLSDLSRIEADISKALRQHE